MRILLGMLCGLLVLSASAAVFAQDDDADSFSGTVTADSPEALEPSTEFDFSFMVENTSSSNDDAANWICEVDMFLPSHSYVLPLDGVSDPDSLHNGEWIHDIDFDANNRIVIMWMHSGLNLSSTAECDLHEDDALEFSFRAITDENATDGFGWRLYASGGASLMGTAYIGEEADDDNDDNDDADDDDETDGDDDTDDNEWPSADDDADADNDSDATSVSCGC